MTPSRGVLGSTASRLLLLSALFAAGAARAIVAPVAASFDVDRLAASPTLHPATTAPLQSELRQSPAWRDWSRAHPGWRVQWDPRTRTARRLHGPGLRLDAVPTAANIEMLCREFLARHGAPTGVCVENLRLASAEHRLERWYVVFEQTDGGLPVRGARADLRIGAGGEVAVFGAVWYGDLRAARHPAVNRDAALAAAAAGLASPPTDVEGELVIVPEPRAGGRVDHLAHELRFRTTDPLGDWLALVDAQSGALLRRENRIRWANLTGYVTAAIESTTVGDPYWERPLRDLRFNIGAGTEFGYTDADGYYDVSTTATDTVDVRVRLSGRYGRVYNEQLGRITPAIDARMLPGTSRDFLWDDSNSRASERDGYYHALVAHQTIKDLDPSFTGVDYTMPIVVDIDDRDCNAYWDGFGINFFGESGRCPSTARIADVVYHEYAHGITDTQYRPLAPSGAMHEGFSDYYAATITNQPLIGRGFRGPGTFIRTVDNTLRWPDDLQGEVHLDGLIIAGALWDLRESLGRARTDSLYHFARYGKSDTFDDYLLDVLFSDDDNANIYDGTPHFDAIVAAFSAHGIGDYSVQIAHAPEPDTEDPNKPLVLTAQILSIFELDPASLLLDWSNDAGASWNTLALLPTGAEVREYSATIPPQTAETAVWYFITAADTAGNTATLPPAGIAAPFTFYVGTDVTPPEIVHTPLPDRPLDAPGGWAVRAEATDNLDRGLASVVVEWSRNSTALDQTQPMAPDGLPRWGAALPPAGASLGDSIFYRLVAADSAAAPNSASEPAAGALAFRVVQGFADDLEAGDAGLVSTGDWQWGAPSQGPTAFSGTNVWATGLDGPYSNETESTLETGPIDLGTWSRAALVFRHWLATEPFYDGGHVQVSSDGGTNWATIDPNRGYTFGGIYALSDRGWSGDIAGWEEAEFDLSQYLGQTIQLRWRFASDAGVIDLGWYLDDIEVVERQVLSVPLALGATSGLDGRVPLAWSPPAGIDPFSPATPLAGYHVYRASAPDLSDAVRLTGAALAPSTASYADTTAVNGVVSWYAVTAVYAEGESEPSWPVQAQAYVAGYAADLAALYVGVPLGGAADTTIVFTNTGTGYLQVDVWPGDATDDSIDDVRIAYDLPSTPLGASPRGAALPAQRWRRDDALRQLAAAAKPRLRLPAGTVPVAPPEGGPGYQLLYTDTNEGSVTPDLAEFWAAAEGGALYFKLTGWQPWGHPLVDFNTLIAIDADASRGTGDEGGADYYVLIGPFALANIGVPAVIAKYDQDIVGIPFYQVFPAGADSLEVGFFTGILGAPERLVLSAMALTPNMQAPIDMLPDPRAMQSWLVPASIYVEAPAGAPTPLGLSFPGLVAPGRYQGKLFLETNAPDVPLVTIPITYDFLITAVEVQDLVAVQEEDDVVVRWRTSRESDVAAFRVLRSRDGGAFEPVGDDVRPAASHAYAFRDRQPEPGAYAYRVGEVGPDGQLVLHGLAEVVVTRRAPRAAFLDPAVPNPFNPTTALRFGIAAAGPAEVALFDARGRKVRTLWKTDRAEPGYQRLFWDGRDDAGRRVASGVYHAQLATAGRSIVRRLTLLK
jgi:Zn-dependent metalloprotease